MFQIEVTNDTATLALEKLADKVQDLRPAMHEIGAYLKRETQLNFVRQSSPDGAPWQPLAASTLRMKRGGSILRESGALMAGIQFRTSAKEAKVSSTGPNYNVFHQSGTSKMPQRKFIGLSDRYVDPITKILRSHLDL